MTTIIINNNMLTQRLDTVAQALKNPKPLGNAIANSLLTVTEDNFDKEGRPTWAGLRPVTLASRKAGKILHQSGHLRRNISTQVNNTEVSIGTNVKYAPTHQFGGTINHPGGTRYQIVSGGKAVFVSNNLTGATSGVTKPHKIVMPARPFLPMDKNGHLQKEAEIAIFDDVDDFYKRIFGLP